VAVSLPVERGEKGEEMPVSLAQIRLQLLFLCAVTMTAHLPSARADLAFNFTKGSEILALEAGNPQQQQLAANVMNSFAAAGDVWSARLTDDITVCIDVDFAEMGVSVLGSTDSHTVGFSYSTVRNALIGDATTPDDAIATANLQMASSLDMLTNDTSVAPPAAAAMVRDNDGSANNNMLDVNRANAKALGLISANHSVDDGAITFSSLMDWDFDRSDGITRDTFDFVSVATHEIGHLLGFVSGVDIVDITAGPDGPQAPMDLDGYRVFGPRDLFRYSADSLTEPNQPSTGAVLDLAVGTDAYFSLDAGVTNLGRVSTGRHNGDGQQASHWKDGLGLGIFDPTSVRGAISRVSALDLLAMDAIGYNRTPASYGDFDADGAVDANDIDALYDALDAGDQALMWDLTFDEDVTNLDLAELLFTILDTTFGDADLDGDVDLDDFTILKRNFAVTSGATWAEGSFDGDGDVDLDDFTLLKTSFGTGAALPEPAGAALLALGALAIRRRS